MLAEKLVIASGNDGPTGPDLGLVRLPMVNVHNLRATAPDNRRRRAGRVISPTPAMIPAPRPRSAVVVVASASKKMSVTACIAAGPVMA
jgi:hypothetical protein